MIKVLLTLLLATVLSAPPAQATTCIGGSCFGGHFYHGEDGGYDEAIIVRCDFGVASSQRLVYEYHYTQEYCGIDTDQIYIRDGEEMWCWFPEGIGYHTKMYDATGWHKISDMFTGGSSCTLRVD